MSPMEIAKPFVSRTITYLLHGPPAVQSTHIISNCKRVFWKRGTPPPEKITKTLYLKAFQSLKNCLDLPPPPREKITKIIRPEYFYVLLGGGYGKIT